MQHQVIKLLSVSGLCLSLLNGCFFSGAEKQWVTNELGTTAAALSRDGRFHLSYDNYYKTLIVWDLDKGEIVSDLGEHDKPNNEVSYIKISDNGRYAITATQINFATWDLGRGLSDGLWEISDGLITDVDISSDGQQIALAVSNGKAIYIDLNSGRRIEFIAHHDKVNSVAISSNGQYIISGGNDRFAYLWSTQTGQIIHTLEHDHRVNKVAIQRDGMYAFTSDSIKGNIVWDLSSGEKITTLRTWSRQQTFSSARFSDSGRQLITGNPHGEVALWSSFTGDKIDSWQADTKDTRPPKAVVYDVAWDKDLLIISATSSGVTQAWK